MTLYVDIRAAYSENNRQALAAWLRSVADKVDLFIEEDDLYSSIDGLADGTLRDFRISVSPKKETDDGQAERAGAEPGA